MTDISLNATLGPKYTLTMSGDQPYQLKVGTLGLSSGISNDPYDAITITSVGAIGAFRAVTVAGAYCTNTAQSLPQYAGVTLVSYTDGQSMKVVRSGLITEGSWSWTPDNPVFIGVNGVLTQTPSALPMRRIGWAISGTQINLDPFPIIGV